MPIEPVDLTTIITQKTKDAVATGGIGLFGGSAYYLYLVSKGQKFKMTTFLINLFLAFFIGYIVGQFIDTSISYRDGLLAISGFASFPILNIFEKKGGDFITKYLGMK